MNRKDMAPLGKETAALRSFESLGRVFEDLSGLSPSGVPRAPQIDIKETDKAVEVRAALPGVEKKDINIDLTENALAISCERREEKEEKGKSGWLRREQSYGRFYRSFPLPAPVKTAEAKAEYRDGVLKLTMPKQKAGKGRSIEIK